MRYRDDDVSRALDLLVLDVVKTLSRPQPTAPEGSDTARPVASAAEDLPDPSAPSPSRASLGRGVTTEPTSRLRSPTVAGRKARGTIAESPATVDHVPFEEERLLDQEEEEFVTRTADWLSKRVNPDELLAVIWTRVTEADPDGFYRPESPMEAAPPTEGPATETGFADVGSAIADRPEA